MKYYPDAKEELDPKLPMAFGRELMITLLCYSDHAHDRRTRRSITGMLAFVGSTPVYWASKRQGFVNCSTYASEFYALRQGVEEISHLRYMLRCLGIPVKTASSLFGDNLGVIQNAANPESDLKKKHVAISYHAVREAIASNTVVPYWLKGKVNMSDIMTKQIGGPEFRAFVDTLFWQPSFVS